MVCLFLSKPTWSGDGDDDSVKHRTSLLNDLDSIMRLVIASRSRSEARLWLCKDLSGISSLSSRQQRDLFLTFLRSRRQKKGLAGQLLQMIFEKQPRKAGSIIAKKSYMLEEFFRGNPRRILLWFSNFSGSGDIKHGKGAKALSQFAFVNRDICWEELVWKGKHGQSPAMVATNPHYFLDLDVEQTVENFLENVPEFWSSQEFADSLRDGEILSMDTEFFTSKFVSLMYKEDMEEIWEVIEEFLAQESFSSFCDHLLIVLDERELCIFLDLLRKFLNPRIESTGFSNPCYCIEVILSKCSGTDSLDELLLLNALINRGRQLLWILREEEYQEEKIKIKDVVQQICTSSTTTNGLVPLMKECIKTKSINSMALLALQSWALQYYLSEGYWPPEAWESLFNSNEISFRQSGNHMLLHPDNGLADDSESDSDERASLRSKRKKKQKRRKKRRRHSDDSNDDILDLDLTDNRMDFQSKAGCWLISTDGYSTSWSSLQNLVDVVHQEDFEVDCS